MAAIWAGSIRGGWCRNSAPPVSKLEKGKITETPVKTQFGYHVIQLEDSKPVEAPPFDEVKPELAQQLGQQNLKKQLDDLKAKAKIEMVEAPAAPAK